MGHFEQRLAGVASAVEAVLAGRLDGLARRAERAVPPRLLAAMQHGVLGGGKRLRPFLVVEAARLIDPASDDKAALVAAAAVECLHCYSLIHDDLPSMDNDDLRRGRPTVHRAFDEATAILAGDGLQTLAFDLLADPTCHPDPAVRAALVLDLARASGPGGMVGGQMLDLSAEGRFGLATPLTGTEIRALQAMKTGALIRASCVMGVRLAQGTAEDVARLTRYGEIVGLAFQLADDLIDATGDAKVAGKATAKDATAGKGTLVSLMGIAAVEAELNALVREASELLSPYGAAAEMLAAAAHFIAHRSA
ncbi:polyprenyl synthetase family protein [Oryzibacter oryziterrae]|uniref:polyprenyl synthetase family protein n=1 Tax=Oryzibacter oryziterrae TaxID=2766474 RepID=UPI001F2923A6|nr:farnesyl diphosphate synthase [Oryzibacter oryziterrae]